MELTEKDIGKINQFRLMQFYGNYLYVNEYNTYDEVMNMTLEQMIDRYNEIKDSNS